LETARRGSPAGAGRNRRCPTRPFDQLEDRVYARGGKAREPGWVNLTHGRQGPRRRGQGRRPLARPVRRGGAARKGKPLRPGGINSQTEDSWRDKHGVAYEEAKKTPSVGIENNGKGARDEVFLHRGNKKDAQGQSKSGSARTRFANCGTGTRQLARGTTWKKFAGQEGQAAHGRDRARSCTVAFVGADRRPSAVSGGGPCRGKGHGLRDVFGA